MNLHVKIVKKKSKQKTRKKKQQQQKTRKKTKQISYWFFCNKTLSAMGISMKRKAIPNKQLFNLGSRRQFIQVEKCNSYLCIMYCTVHFFGLVTIYVVFICVCNFNILMFSYIPIINSPSKGDLHSQKYVFVMNETIKMLTYILFSFVSL